MGKKSSKYFNLQKRSNGPGWGFLLWGQRGLKPDYVVRRIINRRGAPTALHFAITTNSEQPVPNSALSCVPVEAEQQEPAQKRQRHPTLAVPNTVAHQLSKAFAYLPGTCAPLGSRVLHVINQPRSSGQPELESSVWLTETHSAQRAGGRCEPKPR